MTKTTRHGIKAREKKVNKNPVISLNKLGEYLQSNATRRKAILMAAKYPEDWFYKRYAEARVAIVKYFTNEFNPDIIYECINALETKKESLSEDGALTDFLNSDITASISLLESVLDIDTDFFEGLAFSPYKGDNTALDINGLKCIISPDLIIEGKKKGEPVLGLGKFHTSKSYPLEEETLLTIASVLYNFIEEAGFDEDLAERRLCFSFDLYPKEFENAPNSYVRRWNLIESAAEEIVARWESL